MEENNQFSDVLASPSEEGAALDNSGILGARAIGRVLLVTEAADAGSAAATLKGALESSGHTVTVATPDQCLAEVSISRADLVMLEVHDLARASQLCRLLRRKDSRVAIMALLEPASASATWPDLQAAGFDDWTDADVSPVSIEARIGVLLRLAQTGRDLDGARSRLARYMQVDETTQLLNRRFFFQNAQREASRARRYGHALACLMIDIDYLDDMNKTFGYASVEYVLRAVAYTVRQWTRDSDICGRFNERKFVVLLPETDIEGAISVRGKILDALDESKFEWEGQSLPVNVAVGEAERKIGATVTDLHAPEESLGDESDAEPLSTREELAALLEDADAALSVAKSSNKRPGIFVPYMPSSDKAAG